MLRLLRELQRLQDFGFSIQNRDYDLTIEFAGPGGSPFEGKMLKLQLQLSPRFPFEPPSAAFLTPVCHPNIDDQGKICMDLLKLPPAGVWKPTVDLVSVVLAVKHLLAEPNLDSPLLPSIARLYREDYAAYCQLVQEKLK